jgi:hypothetical protein
MLIGNVNRCVRTNSGKVPKKYLANGLSGENYGLAASEMCKMWGVYVEA